MAEGGVTGSADGSKGSLAIKAILIGATGAIGECLLGELLASKNYSNIVVLGRREAQVPEKYGVDQQAETSSGRLQQHIIDFEKISDETVGEYFKDKDIFFCTLGTTRRDAGSAEAFRHVDYDYVVNCANVAKDAGVSFMSYVSSQGANPNSWFLNTKTKGQVEAVLKNLKFKSTSIFKPGLLDRGSKSRLVEKVAVLYNKQSLDEAEYDMKNYADQGGRYLSKLEVEVDNSHQGLVMSSISVGNVAKAMSVEGEKQMEQKSSEAEKTNLYFNSDILKFCSDN